MTYSTHEKLTTEDAETRKDLTENGENYEEYREQGQQNDSFNSDIFTAGYNAREDKEEGGFDSREQARQSHFYDASVTPPGNQTQRNAE